MIARDSMAVRLSAVLAMMGVAAGAVACAPDTDNNPDSSKKIRVATSPGPYSEMFEQGIGPILEKQGYELAYTPFSELQQADIALNEGSQDVNVDQHTAYMTVFNRDAKGHLIAFTPIPTKPTGIYSEKHTDVKQVAKGQKVAIPQDASNLMRALRLLVKLGWIQIDPKADPLKLNVTDITDNPYDLEVVTMNDGTLPRSLQDTDWAVLPGSVSYSANIDPNLEIAQEDLRPELILQAVTNEKNKDAQFTKDISAAYRSPEFAKYVAAHNKNNYWFIPPELRQQ